jgi:hypothetical protein
MTQLIDVTRMRLNPELAGVDEDRLQSLAKVVSARAERLCQREFSQAVRTETYDGDGSPELWLNVIPVTSIDSVSILDDDGTENSLTVSHIRIDSDIGRIRIVSSEAEYYVFPRGFQNIKITYTGGFASIPEDLQEALVSWAQYLHARSRQDTSIESEKLGDYSRTVKDASDLPRDVRSAISFYRLRRMQ